MSLSDIERHQKDIVSDILNHQVRSLKSHNVDFLRTFVKTDPKIIQNVFGEMGDRLYNLLKIMDLDHPLISTLYNKQDHQKFSVEATQLLEIGRVGLSAEMMAGVSLVSKTATKILKKHIRIFNKNYVRTHLDRKLIRFLSSADDRELYRKRRRNHRLDLSKWLKDTIDLSQYPNNLSMFYRGDTSYQDEIEKAKKKAVRFKDLNCSLMYKEIINSINKLKSSSGDYFGFRKISLARAAIILAKMHYSNLLCLDKRYSPTLLYRGKPYAPFLLGLPKFIARFSLPSDVQKVIDHLEHYPALNGKPLFDEYCLLMPSIEQLDCLNKCFDTYPIVIGLADGDAYFICYLAM